MDVLRGTGSTGRVALSASGEGDVVDVFEAGPQPLVVPLQPSVAGGPRRRPR